MAHRFDLVGSWGNRGGLNRLLSGMKPYFPSDHDGMYSHYLPVVVEEERLELDTSPFPWSRYCPSPYRSERKSP